MVSFLEVYTRTERFDNDLCGTEKLVLYQSINTKTKIIIIFYRYFTVLLVNIFRAKQPFLRQDFGKREVANRTEKLIVS